MDASQVLRDRVSAVLWQLEEESLRDVCTYLKCDGLDSGEPRSKPRRTLIKMAESVLDEIEEKQEEDEVSQCITDLLTFIERQNRECIQPSKEQQSGETAPKRGLEEKYFLPRPPVLRTTDYPLKNRPEPGYTLPEVMLRREFKICGQVGESGQKEKLSYPSLVRQMEMGIEKGHTENEIVEAVIRAVSPGLPLRDMLEIKRGLTLSTLLTILKGHYKVDSSTELYHQLLNISQEAKESALNFVFRAIELKEKLLWKAANDDTDEQYGRATIQRKFLRSIETGLLSDSVKFQILPHLSDLSTTDEELIERVNEAAKVESERQEKRKRSTAVKTPRVQELQVDLLADHTPAQSCIKPKDSNSAVAIKTLKGKESKAEHINTQQIVEELRAEMKQMFQAVMETSHRPLGPMQRVRGCRKCREEEMGDNCPHCFKCGQEGHFSRGCRVQRTPSGNGQGLLRREHQ